MIMMQKPVYKVATVCAVVFVLAILARRDDSVSVAGVHPPISTPEREGIAARTESAHYESFEHLEDAAYSSSTYRGNGLQQIAGVYETHVGVASSRTMLATATIEVAPTDGSEHVSYWRFISSREIVLFDARIAGDLLVLLRHGDRVYVERWLTPTFTGQLFATRQPASYGSPWTTPPDTIAPYGGTWIEPSARGQIPAVVERRIALTDFPQTVNDTEIRGAVLDPDGRFYLLIFEDRIEQRLLTQQGGLPVYTFSGAQMSVSFAEIVSSFAMDCSVGRVCYFQFAPVAADDFVLIDYDNDGVIDDEQTAPAATLSSWNTFLSTHTRLY